MEKARILSRRDFLKLAAFILGDAALSACVNPFDTSIFRENGLEDKNRVKVDRGSKLEDPPPIEVKEGNSSGDVFVSQKAGDVNKTELAGNGGSSKEDPVEKGVRVCFQPDERLTVGVEGSDGESLNVVGQRIGYTQRVSFAGENGAPLSQLPVNAEFIGDQGDPCFQITPKQKNR